MADVAGLTEVVSSDPLAVFGDQGWWRNQFIHSRRGARLLNAFTTPLWNRYPPRGFGIITTTGRRSGVPRSRSVRLVFDGRIAYLVSIVGERADWLRNARADNRVNVRAAGLRCPGRARDLRDATERRRAEELYCGTVHGSDYLECFLHLPGRPSRKKIDALLRHWLRHGTLLAIDCSDRPITVGRTTTRCGHRPSTSCTNAAVRSSHLTCPATVRPAVPGG